MQKLDKCVAYQSGYHTEPEDALIEVAEWIKKNMRTAHEVVVTCEMQMSTDADYFITLVIE